MDRNAKCKVYPRDNSMEFVQQRQTDSLLPPRVNFLDWRLMATQHTSDFASRWAQLSPKPAPPRRWAGALAMRATGRTGPVPPERVRHVAFKGGRLRMASAMHYSRL